MSATLLRGDALATLRELPPESAQACITSPPYWGLRDYGVEGQLGLEATFPEYIANLVEVFREVRRVLREDGALWLNLGDCYATGAGRVGACPGGGAQGAAWRGPMTQPNRLPQPGLKPKDLVGIPWRVALALQADGWWLRGEVVWHKPNPAPDSARDRPSRAHESLFLLTRSEHYFYDKAGESSVWSMPVTKYRGAHFATFPEALAERCVSTASHTGSLVLDPFNGAGTTGLAAQRLGRDYVGIDLNPKYLALTRARLGLQEAA